MNFDEETVENYISGNDKEDVDVEKLEDYTPFMIAVFKKIVETKGSFDIKMIRFPSERVKKDPKFVMETLKLCGKNIAQMLSVAKTYLESVSDNEKETLEYKEIVLYIDKYKLFDKVLGTEGLDDIQEDIYKLVDDKSMEIISKEEGKVPENSESRFNVISKNNNDSEIIKEHFARWYIYSIFHDYDIENELLAENEVLEKTLRKNGVDLSKVNRNEIPQFIIEYIKTIDDALAKYLLTHMTFLNKLELEINRVIRKVVNKKLSTDENYLKVLYGIGESATESSVSNPHSYGDVDSESTYKY